MSMTNANIWQSLAGYGHCKVDYGPSLDLHTVITGQNSIDAGTETQHCAELYEVAPNRVNHTPLLQCDEERQRVLRTDDVVNAPYPQHLSEANDSHVLLQEQFNPPSKPKSRSRMPRKNVHGQRIWRYAKKKFANPKLSLEDWESLLRIEDHEACRLKDQFNESYRKRMERCRLRRRLGENPDCAMSLQRLSDAGYTKDEIMNPKSKLEEYEKKMCRKKKHIIQNLICLLRKDVKKINLDKIAPRIVSMDPMPSIECVEERYGAARKQTDSISEDDAEAMQIIRLLREIRYLIRWRLFGPRLREALERLDQWMKTNRRIYEPIVLPLEIWGSESNV